jgi:hypothetical protein
MLHRAAAQLAWTLKHVPGVLRVTVENCTIVIHTSGALTGPVSWFGYPVRVTRD